MAAWRRFLARLRRVWQAGEWPIIGILALLALVLGFHGMNRERGGPSAGIGFWDNLYLSLQLFVLGEGDVVSPTTWQLGVARLLAPAVAAYAFVAAVLTVFRENLQMAQLRFWRNHTVVCGLGTMGGAVAAAERAAGRRVVVVEIDPANPHIEPARETGTIVVLGDARDPVLLARVRAARAARMLVTCGHDGVNGEIAVRIRRLVGDKPTAGPVCAVHIVDRDLLALLAAREIGSGHAGRFRIEFFNVFEAGARTMLARYPPFPSEPAGGGPVRIVVVGLERFGEGVVVETVRLWREEDRTGIVHIMAVDGDAGARAAALLARWPSLAESCQLAACEMAVDDPAFLRGDFLSGVEPSTIGAAYVCLPDESGAVSAGLVLDRLMPAAAGPVVVRVAGAAGLGSLLDRSGGSRPSRLEPFALLEGTCGPDVLFGGTDELIARALHEEYLRTRRAGTTRSDDPALAPWESLPDDFREAARAQAAHVGTKLAAAGYELAPAIGWPEDTIRFDPAEIEKLARLEHERWVEERLQRGWLPGRERDPANKRTPHLVPWEDLPEEVKEIDRAFVRRLPSLLAGVGFRMVPTTRD